MYIERNIFMSRINQDLETLVLQCQRSSSYFTAQTILAFIDNRLKNTRNMGELIPLFKLKNKVINTFTQQTSLRDLYSDVLKVIDKHNLRSPEMLQLRSFIELLKQKSIY